MQIHNNILYVEKSTLIELGVPYSTYNSGIERNIETWKNIIHPEFGRLFEYEALGNKYKELIKATYGCPYAYYKKQEKLKELEILEALIEVDDKEYSFFLDHYNTQKAMAHAKLCGLLKYCARANELDAIALGYKNRKALLLAFIDYMGQHDFGKKISSIAVLYRRIRAYKQGGAKSVLSGKLGKKNARKLNEEQIGYMIALASRAEKPPCSVIAKLYNRKAKEAGWNQITERTVLNYLKDPEIQKRWMISRHGNKIRYKYFDPTNGRIKAKSPDLLWVMDGTPIDWYYQETKRVFNKEKQCWNNVTSYWNRVSMFMIIDAHSWGILGYYLSKTENHVAVIGALRDAVRSRMILPQQIMYDKSSSGKAINSILRMLANFNTPNAPYGPKPKVIESVFGHFQQEFLRYAPHGNWAGQGIKSKKLDSHFNPEYLKANRDKLPTLEQLTGDIERYIKAWNCYATENREAPVDLMRKKSKGRVISHEDYIHLFYVERNKLYKYHNYGIEIILQGIKYRFNIWDKDLYLNKLLGQKFKVKYDPDCMDFIYLMDKKGRAVLDDNGKPIILPREQELKQAIGDYEEGDGALVQEYIQHKKGIKEELEKYRIEADELAAEHGINMTAEFVRKEAFNRAEEVLKKETLEEGGPLKKEKLEEEEEEWMKYFQEPYKHGKKAI